MHCENGTPYAHEMLILNDEKGRDLLLVILKGTWKFDHDGRTSLAETQDPVELADQYYDDPETSSIRYASDFSFDKPATDIAMVGTAYAPEDGARYQEIQLTVGNVTKAIVAAGERTWSGAGLWFSGNPEMFASVKLQWENAFGGKDHSSDNEKHHSLCEYNPVGKGFIAKGSKLPIRGTSLPTLIDPDADVKAPGKCKKPGGFGFIGPSWLPRKQYAGTYDEAWQKSRMPLLPKDFDFRFFNAAHPDLIYPGYLRGGEPVEISGIWGNTTLAFALPEFSKITIDANMEGEDPIALNAAITTCFIDCESQKINLVMTGALRIDGSLNRLQKILIRENS